MHSLDPNTSNVPAFLVKLWRLVEDPDCDDLISWSEKQNSFIIRHQATFARNLLPRYFKHNNMASFIRQLNMYGFRKVVNYEKGGMSLDESGDEMEFYHPCFMKGSESLLELIKRKLPSTKSEMNTKTTPKDILTDLTSIRDRQESMNNILIGMKKENELLWRELSSLRQKHKTQEQIIQKVIQFLVSLVQTGKQGIGVKRKVAHMLKDSAVTSPKRSRQLDVVRGKKSDFFISVPDDKTASLVGPVIHEVTELDHDDMNSVDLAKSLRSVCKSSSRLKEVPDDTVVNVPSPAETLDLLKSQSIRTPLLFQMGSNNVEEVLGLPADFTVGNDVTVPSEIIDVIADSNTTEKRNSALETMDVTSIPDKDDISISNENSPVISIPESPGSDLVSSINVSKDGIFVLSPNVVPFSPSAVTIVDGENFVEPVNNINTAQGSGSNNGKVFKNDNWNSADKSKNKVLPVSQKKEHAIKIVQKVPSNQISSKKEALFNIKVENQENTEQNNLQLAISDSNSNAPNITKNAFSNHVRDVEENLEWLQEELTSGSLNLDSSMLLELFSSDEAANNAAQTCQLNTESNGILKDTDSNIIGNELVQFTPSMLDLDLYDMENPLFMDYLNECEDNQADDMKSNNTAIITKNPIKQEKKKAASCCAFESNVKANHSVASRGAKGMRGRGKRKAK